MYATARHAALSAARHGGDSDDDDGSCMRICTTLDS